MTLTATYPRPTAVHFIGTLALALLTACSGGGGSGSDSAATILGVTQPAPPSAAPTEVAQAVPPTAQPTEVTSAAIHYQGHREGGRVTIGRGGSRLTPLASPVGGEEVHVSSLLSPITDLFGKVRDAFHIADLFGNDSGSGPSVADFFPAGPQDEWTYTGDAEILQGADPVFLFGLPAGARATWGFTLVAQGGGLYFSRQEAAGGVITAEPALLWIPDDLHTHPPLQERRFGESTLTYTPDQGSPRTAHITRTIVLGKRGPHATLHSFFNDVLVFWVTDAITRSDGTSAQRRYELYLARDFGPVEGALRENITGEVVRHTEIERATIGGRLLPDTDGDGILDVDDRDDDNDGVPDDHLGSATPGETPCTTTTVDCDDALPKAPSEQADFDGDGLGNHSDPDGDNDGVGDDGDTNGVRHDHPCTTIAIGCDDAFPLDPGEWADADGDGTGNIADLDDDNDGVADVADACPYTRNPCPQVTTPQTGVATRIVITGDPSPDGGGHFVDLGSSDLNDRGTVLFAGHVTTEPGGEAVDALLLARGGTLTTVAQEGQPLPGPHDSLARIGGSALNDRDQVAFSAYGTDTGRTAPQNYQAIFRDDGGALTEMGYRGGYFDLDAIPRFLTLPTPALNNRGEVAFWNGTIYRSDGTTLTPIAFDGQADPAGGGTLKLETPALGTLNDVGQIAFESLRMDEPAPVPRGIFRGDGETLTAIVSESDLVQAGTTDYLSRRLGPLHLNEVGQVAFRAIIGTLPDRIFGGRLAIVRGDGDHITTLAGGSYDGIALNNGGQVASITQIAATRKEAIWVTDATSTKEIAHQGEVVPGGDGTFATFQFGFKVTFNWGCASCPPSVSRPLPGATPNFAHLALTDTGTVMFRAALAGALWGTDDDQGVYLGDPKELLRVVRRGDPLAGSTVRYLLAFKPHLNRHGQVAYQVELADGRDGIFLFTPRLHWRANAGANGAWDDPTNWTVGLNPGAPHPVFITPASGLTVTGPSAPVTIAALTVGTQGSGTATLALQPTGDLTVTHGIVLQEAGALTGNGTLITDVANAGRIEPGLAAGRLTVDGNYTQGATGRLAIDIGAAGDDLLAVTGTAALDGTLVVTLADGFVPRVGETFTVLTADGGVTGQFTAHNGLDLGNGLTLEAQYRPNAVVLVATQP